MRSPRRAAILALLPPLHNPVDPARLSLDSACQNWPALEAALARFLCPAGPAHGAGPGEQAGEAGAPYVEALVEWLGRAGPARLARLKGNAKGKGVAGAIVYTVAEEDRDDGEFAARLARSGGASFLAWHGSPAENWIRILWAGLMVSKNFIAEGLC